jgi:hypothetical protein
MKLAYILLSQMLANPGHAVCSTSKFSSHQLMMSFFESSGKSTIKHFYEKFISLITLPTSTVQTNSPTKTAER